MPSRAVILFGHGSRDPLWRVPIESVAAQLAVAQPGLSVRCAYLELSTPDLPAAAAELTGTGAQSITIVPMFLGTGRHAREDLPVLVDRLRMAYPSVEFKVQQAVGEDARVLALLAEIAAE